jgi:hypothetical protein
MPYSVIRYTETSGFPDVVGCHHVSAQASGFFVAYGFTGNKGVTLAILYKDTEGAYLVHAEEGFLDLQPAGETLDAVVDNDPGDWRTYRSALVNTGNGDRYGRARDFGDIPRGTLVALGRGAPLPLNLMPEKFQGAGGIIGMQGSATHACAEFDPVEIEEGATWYGDDLE